MTEPKGRRGGRTPLPGAEVQQPRASRDRIRPAGERDLDRLAALWSAITEHHRSFDPLFTQRPGAEGELRDLLRAHLREADAGVFVYDEDGDLPGLCIVRIDRAAPILEEVERAEISDLGVRASHRRRGIGRALAEHALAWVAGRGIERVEVQVATRNAEGQAFWRELGFGDLMDVLHKRL